jgi:hypothetical protein
MSDEQQAFNELRMKQNELQKQLMQVSSQQGMKERQKRKSELTTSELAELPAGTNLYRSVGKTCVDACPFLDISVNPLFIRDRVSMIYIRICGCSSHSFCLCNHAFPALSCPLRRQFKNFSRTRPRLARLKSLHSRYDFMPSWHFGGAVYAHSLIDDMFLFSFIHAEATRVPRARCGRC